MNWFNCNSLQLQITPLNYTNTLRDKTGEKNGWGDDEYSLNVLISKQSLPLLSDSECKQIKDTDLYCVSPEVEGMLINYASSPVIITDFKAPIEFSCRPKDGSSSLSNQWTIDYLLWVDVLIPNPPENSFDYSSCNATEYVFDSFCHDTSNTPECNFDGGACCGEKVDKRYCLDCACKAPETCTEDGTDRVGDPCFGKKIYVLCPVVAT